MVPGVSTRPRRRREAAKPVADSKSPKLLIFGGASRLKSVLEALDGLSIDVVPVGQRPAKLDAETTGVVVVSPLARGDSIVQAVDAFCRATPRGKAVPIFAVVDEDVADRSVRKIYAAGATAVFEWPREARLLAPLVAELVGVALVRGNASEPRSALTRTLEAHLRLATHAASGVKVRAAGSGEARLSGSVATYWRKKKLERLVARVPGVKRVVTDDLRVAPSGLSDRRITAAARSVLRNTTKVHDASVSVAVHQGRIAVAGTVASRQELRRVVEILSNVTGVRGIDNALVVSSVGKQRDRALADRLNGNVTKWFPKERVRVSAFGQVAVVSGTVSSPARRQEIGALIDQDPSVTRIVDKLEIP